ncbi:hypothetical protein W2_gp043c [Caulobacter phage W2]|uniref:Uncharacterized protein n=1 Tax=Caulobacter phage TMCBR4 TaxID=3028191 RepID=A0AAE9ZJ48_9CAUD|nr:hypothetical protein TMCBR4_gp044c [Caulobacter phage TMCBR4]WDS38411.1 hypothetical protein W2_gp043c [Caulobacter phage W2]
MTDNTTAQASEDGFRPVEYLFKGMRLDWQGKPQAVLGAIGEDDAAESFFDWKAKTFGKFTVGGVYTIPVLAKDDGARSFRLGHAKFTRLFEDRGEREAMNATHRAAQGTVDRAKRLEATVKEDAKLTASLAPLRAAYAKCRTGAQRVAFELYVLDCLRKG